MVQQRQTNRQQAGVATRTTSLPAPVAGWNARDGLDAMQPTDAVEMVNWVPGSQSVRLRRGHAEHAVGVGTGNVETIAEFHSGAVRKMLAAGGGGIYDVSTGTSALLRSGFASDRWQHVNFDGRMGLVNGVDTPQQFDGQTVSDMLLALVRDDASSTEDWTLGGGWAHDVTNGKFIHAPGSTLSLSRSLVNLTDGTEYLVTFEVVDQTSGTVTSSVLGTSGDSGAVSANGEHTFTFVADGSSDSLGFSPNSDFDGSITFVSVRRAELDPDKLVNLAAFRNRTYFVEDDSQRFWFSRIGALGGDLAPFDLSRVGQFGGKLVNIVPWSIGGAATASEAATGLQQLLAFVMSSGEVIIYSGSNPGSLNDWALSGVYRTAAPLDVRGAAVVANDAILLTQEGAVPMSALLQQGQFATGSAITNRIRNAFLDAIGSINDSAPIEGWQAIFYPAGPWYIVNVPRSEILFDQFVSNVSTGAWFRVTGWNARSWGVFRDRLFFGTTDGRVMEADKGFSDDGGPIDGSVRAAYMPIADRNLGRIRAISPVISGDSPMTVAFKVDRDFNNVDLTIDDLFDLNPLFTPWESQDPTWDQADRIWEQGSGIAIAPWLTRSAQGATFSIRARARMPNSVEWFSTTLKFDVGTGLT